MERYSLEEDEANDLFIPQKSPSDKSDENITNNVLGERTDFQSPCVSLVNSSQPQYSDISDDDFMEIPSSQVCQNLVNV